VSTVPKLWRDFQGQSQSRVLQGVITAACLLWGKMNEAELSVLITLSSVYSSPPHQGLLYQRSSVFLNAYLPYGPLLFMQPFQELHLGRWQVF